MKNRNQRTDDRRWLAGLNRERDKPSCAASVICRRVVGLAGNLIGNCEKTVAESVLGPQATQVVGWLIVNHGKTGRMARGAKKAPYTDRGTISIILL